MLHAHSVPLKQGIGLSTPLGLALGKNCGAGKSGREAGWVWGGLQTKKIEASLATARPTPGFGHRGYVRSSQACVGLVNCEREQVQSARGGSGLWKPNLRGPTGNTLQHLPETCT